uniref:Dynein heavy chain tail domain-containing protein n=1 Tax=Ciona savignyi TaxID=51511 RepID=H2ZL68_CIOSA
ESQSKAMMRDEFLMSLSKFVKHIQRTSQQLEGEIRLDIPNLNLEGDMIELTRRPGLMEDIETACGNWQQQISAAIEQQLKKKPQGNGPLAEIDFWRERNAALSALSEQLKLPTVTRMLDVLAQKADTTALSNFKMSRDELAKYYTEAKDNVRFLTTLERHFKHLAQGSGFHAVVETIPSMMNALRMVWIISRHYNKDERMVPLMERIAWELAERVSRVINIRTIYRETPEQVKVKTSEARQMLELWKETYFDVRAKIEASGRDARWEFDRKRLFDRTDYMAGICQNLYNVAQVLEEFYNIFGPELKAVTGDPKRIEDVLKRVDGLVGPIETVKVDPFELKSATIWKTVMTWFEREVEIINKLFLQAMHDPPLTKNQPPVAGAISWERSLFNRMKHTIIRFQSVDDMLMTDQGKSAKAKYLSVARQMKDYEDNKYQQWIEYVDGALPGFLKKNLLMHPLPPTTPAGKQNGGIQYVVNFAPELQEITTETKYMEQLGFMVPDLARNVALQEDKYFSYISGLAHMLNRYHTLLASLDPAEAQLLEDHIRELKRVLKPGYKRLNWNSLGIQDYITRCDVAIGKFESLVNQIQKNSKDIDSRIQMIRNAELFKRIPPKPSGDLPSVKEFFEYVEMERAKDLEALSRKYRAIGPLLTKMEGLVAHTNTGKSPRLHRYYEHWEKQMFDSLSELVTRNMTSFNDAVTGNEQLMQIETILSTPEIVLHPAVNEVHKLTVQCVRDCVESTKHFVRWMAGTCIETPAQQADGQDEPMLITFFQDIMHNPRIAELFSSISSNMQKILSNLSKFLGQQKWKRYRTLWKLEKTIVMEKFAAKNPSCVAYDDKLLFYSKIAEDVFLQATPKDEQCLRLNLLPLAMTVQEHALQWVQSLGKLLNDSAKENLFSLRDMLVSRSI